MNRTWINSDAAKRRDGNFRPTKFVKNMLVLSTLWTSAKSQKNSTSQREILETVYLACDGENWVNNLNWLDPEKEVCDWFGIRCSKRVYSDEEEFSVVGVNLEENRLKCTLPGTIFDLPHLNLINLGSNPDLDMDFESIGSNNIKETLDYLLLDSTAITSISGLDEKFSGLKSLVLSGNDLTGTFPAEVLRLKNLNYLDLGHNLFTGTLPDEIGTLVNLKVFLIRNNAFTGQIPSTTGRLRKVETFDLSQNILSGTIPEEITTLKTLSMLSMNDQAGPGIHGNLVDFANLSSLYYLNLAGNSLSGAVPPTFLENTDASSLFTLVDLGGNLLSGTLPTELSRFEHLRIYLADNKIAGIDPQLCGRDGWFFNEVGMFGCNAILCPPQTYSEFGRQISEEFPCTVCSTGSEAPFFGSVECSEVEDERNSNSPEDFSFSWSTDSLRSPTPAPVDASVSVSKWSDDTPIPVKTAASKRSDDTPVSVMETVDAETEQDGIENVNDLNGVNNANVGELTSSSSKTLRVSFHSFLVFSVVLVIPWGIL